MPKTIAIVLGLVLAVTGCAAAPTLAPEIRADAWLNGTPPEAQRGKVLLVEFWTWG
jgi:hypothetical protein